MGDVLKEDGGKILLEDGVSAVLLEGDVPTGGDVLLESGDGILLEDGSGDIELEAPSAVFFSYVDPTAVLVLPSGAPGDVDPTQVIILQ